MCKTVQILISIYVANASADSCSHWVWLIIKALEKRDANIDGAWVLADDMKQECMPLSTATSSSLFFADVLL